jgi:hypothetical protein
MEALAVDVIERDAFMLKSEVSRYISAVESKLISFELDIYSFLKILAHDVVSDVVLDEINFLTDTLAVPDNSVVAATLKPEDCTLIVAVEFKEVSDELEINSAFEILAVSEIADSFELEMNNFFKILAVDEIIESLELDIGFIIVEFAVSFITDSTELEMNFVNFILAVEFITVETVELISITVGPAVSAVSAPSV